jgi:ubiquinone/menaquinone biosynthesis C-methylase UbiE
MDQTTIDTYNKLAHEYDEEVVDFWDTFPRSFIDTFVELSDKRLLDIGSGSGRDGVLFTEKGIEVTCLDASEEMVKITTEKGLRSIVGDFLHLPFKENEFNSIWAYTSLLHISKKDIDVALEEIKRVLSVGGIFGLGLIEGNTEEYKLSSGVQSPRLFSFYTKEEIEALLNKHGFEIVYFECFKPKSKNYLNFIARKLK